MPLGPPTLTPGLPPLLLLLLEPEPHGVLRVHLRGVVAAVARAVAVEGALGRAAQDAAAASPPVVVPDRI